VSGWGRAGAVVGPVALCTSLLVGCSSAKPKECHTESGATICLVTQHPHLYVLQSSGLKPGSAVSTQLTGPHVQATSDPPLTLFADAGGHIIGGNGLNVPPGNGPVTFTATGTSATGARVVVTFTR
jgi:hypothetical protein